MENNPDRFSVIARSRKQVARPHASRARCDPPISARRSPSSRHLAPINAQVRCGLKEGVATRIAKDKFSWFGHLERMNDSRLAKEMCRAKCVMDGSATGRVSQKIYEDQTYGILRNG
ncbi:hypothetical protein EVAR_60090_1 [Eumeta japonica]|uniref:Uncharacterized protein n=1 Tax=Eumeta variegata TaxID=151549 RepID=A0A4C1YN10_EUMVA|nr:hypothetical protein EVAR_60090_1 [Eumeta japonica]